MKKKEEEAKAAQANKKEKEKKMKEINKNFPRKDKRVTHRFLMKHGLTAEEAKDYMTLGTNFNTKSLSEHDKAILDGNFLAQVYAFRKLRDRLLLTNNPASIYDVKTVAVEANPNIQKRNKLNDG